MLNFSLYKQVRRCYQPKRVDFLRWLKKSVLQEYKQINIDVSIVSKELSRKLNFEYRGKDMPTNVISLEYTESRELYNILCGELILCDAIINEESVIQNKQILSHYAHMFIHGILHLQGLDHQQDVEANYMEGVEINILEQFGFANPYLEIESD